MQISTHFPVFANHFDNFAHSGANHYVRWNVSVIFVLFMSMPPCYIAAGLYSSPKPLGCISCQLWSIYSTVIQ